MKKLPPIERLKYLFDYDPDTGILRRKSRSVRGRIVSSQKRNGYLRVNIGGQRFAVHRICFAIAHGIDPWPCEIDHVDHDRANNRISNLRIVSSGENQKNRSKSVKNKSGYTGVRWHVRDRIWYSEGVKTENGSAKKIHLGCFADIEPAVSARKKWEAENSYHQNHGV